MVFDHTHMQRSSVLMIERATHSNDPWSGDMAFPGGRHEKTDASNLETARRETREELGLDLSGSAEAGGAKLLGRLSDRRATRRGASIGLVVTPYLFSVSAQPPLNPNYEVADTVWVPMDYLANFANRKKFFFRYAGMNIPLPCYPLQGRQKIWGLSLAMIDELLEAAGLKIPVTRSLERL